MSDSSTASVRWLASFAEPGPAFHQLHEMASRFTGLKDFGDRRYEQSLEVLLD